MAKTYPFVQRNDRPLAVDYQGPAFVWDIDKTYLATHFSSWRGLLKIPFELAVDKQAIPGMPEVLRGLRRGAGRDVACHPLYFISASPLFLRGPVEGKMLRDGVEYDGITFKDWFRTMVEGRPDRLFEQMGFKTAALLRGRQDRISAVEYLFGDDFEKDAEAFFIYASYLGGQLNLRELESALARNGVSASDLPLVLREAEALPAKRGRVNRIFIHLERNSEPKAYKKYGALLVPVRGAYQLALVLERDGLLDAAALASVRQAVQAQPRYRFSRIKELEEDAKQRGIWSRAEVKKTMTQSKKKPLRAKKTSAHRS